MKNAMVQLALVLIGITSIHAVKLLQASPPHTHIYSLGAADKVRAIHGKDSLRRIGVYVRATDGQ
jgi:hypothetical protein